MRYSFKYGFCFVHIPKTGGTSIARAIDDSLPSRHIVKDSSAVGALEKRFDKLLCKKRFRKHEFFLDVLRQRPEISDVFTFAVVRNPWDWVSSFYRFIAFSSRNPDTGRPWEHHLRKYVSGMCFEEFVEWVVFEHGLSNLSSVRKSSCSDKRVLQKNWVSDEHGHVLVKKCLRLEAINQQWEEISKEIGVPVGKLPFHNASEAWKDKTSYTPRSRRLIGEYFEDDIRCFGY